MKNTSHSLSKETIRFSEFFRVLIGTLCGITASVGMIMIFVLGFRQGFFEDGGNKPARLLDLAWEIDVYVALAVFAVFCFRDYGKKKSRLQAVSILLLCLAYGFRILSIGVEQFSRVTTEQMFIIVVLFLTGLNYWNHPRVLWINRALLLVELVAVYMDSMELLWLFPIQSILSIFIQSLIPVFLLFCSPDYKRYASRFMKHSEG